ncbi:MAG: hypothetical protein JWO87_892 [Phycisphaerales bacterium]|nr:hypothetical protein [Phycisphaerales bacterium]
MSQLPDPSDQADDLQFKTYEPPLAATRVQASARACTVCNQPIQDAYYTVGDQLICPRCRDQIAGAPGGSRAGRVLKATALGLGAGIVGALVWCLVRRVAHVQLGLLAVAVGYLVGRAVLVGSGNRGGIGYQILAVVLTYCAICANFMPDVVELLMKDSRFHTSAHSGPDGATNTNADAGSKAGAEPTGNPSSPAPPTHIGPAKAIAALVILIVLVFVMTLIIPFSGVMSPIGLLIAAFALWEAWKINTRRHIPIAGPYTLSPGTPGAWAQK